MKKYSLYTLLLCCCFAFWNCQSKNKVVTDTSPVKEATQAATSMLEDATGWAVLFDGVSGANWRGYGKDDFPAKGWGVDKGALTLIAKSKGGDLITKEQYENFDFRFDFRLTENANSGILYLVQELEGKPIYLSAPEYQLIDDASYIKKSKGEAAVTKHHLTADNYDLQSAPANKKLNPFGQWNTGRIVINQGQVEHYLNGEKVVEYKLHSPEWKAMVAGSKFADWEAYGQAKKGHIGLQDHGDSVSFRNIRIKRL